MRKLTIVMPLLFVLANWFALPCLAQNGSRTVALEASNSLPAAASEPGLVPASVPAPVPAAPSPTPAVESPGGTLSRFGVGIHMSTLGPGAEVAFEVSQRINIRGGFNYFNYTDNFTNSGVNYGGTVKFESGEAHLDYFFWHSLHVSPGVVFSNGSLLNASLGVPAGKTFTLSGTTYTSSATNPLAGTGVLNFNRVAPSVLLGIGNLVPRGNHHFSAQLEIGGAFRGTPGIALNFTGMACDQFGNNCQNVASDSTFQSSVTAQQNKFNNDISFLKFFPIISLGFGFKL